MMFGGLEARVWHYRRDPALTLPFERARRISAQRWPYLAPEAALLFKAGKPGAVLRSKDRVDAGQVFPALGPEARQWLAAAVRRGGAAHPWLAALG